MPHKVLAKPPVIFYNDVQLREISDSNAKGSQLMQKKNNEIRRHDRYDTDVKAHFYVPYELKTKVNFQFKKNQPDESLNKRFSGISKNVSAGGICFVSELRLEPGDYILIDMYLPGIEQPIPMEGEVRWSRVNEEGLQFYTGVQLLKVQDKPVEQTIYYDQEHQVIWSNVLEQVLGSFAILHKKMYPNP